MRIFKRPELSILLVCTANVCRSPMAHGLLQHALRERGLYKHVMVDSAGTSAGQPGRRPDPRAQQVCRQANINISRLRARQVRERDFQRFDIILAVDEKAFQWLSESTSPADGVCIMHMGEWNGAAEKVDVPDPYYGNLSSFEQVFVQLQGLMENLAAHLECQLAHKTA